MRPGLFQLACAVQLPPRGGGEETAGTVLFGTMKGRARFAAR